MLLHSIHMLHFIYSVHTGVQFVNKKLKYMQYLFQTGPRQL